MTSISEDFFEKRYLKQSNSRKRFNEYCNINNYIGLSLFLRCNDLSEEHLYYLNLIKFKSEDINKRIVGIGCFENPSITDLGRDFIGTFLEEEYSFEDFYVFKAEKLLEFVKTKLDLASKNDLRENYKSYHLAKYGTEAYPIDDELPFHQRSFIQGPFCDLTISTKGSICCDWCGLDLNKRPKLEIGLNRLCYRCHLIAYNKVASSTDIHKQCSGTLNLAT